MPQLLPKFAQVGYSTCGIQMFHQICSLTAPAIQALNQSIRLVFLIVYLFIKFSAFNQSIRSVFPIVHTLFCVTGYEWAQSISDIWFYGLQHGYGCVGVQLVIQLLMCNLVVVLFFNFCDNTIFTYYNQFALAVQLYFNL